jgi:hypothetical protein
MGLKVTNNAFGTLNASINSSATTIVLVAGQGARFPTLSAGDYFYATLIDTSNNLEIVKCTARSTDTLTVVRGQDSTTARAYATNDRFELRPTAVMLNEIITTAEAALPKAGGVMASGGRIQFQNAEGHTLYGIRGTRYGYASGYRSLQIGNGANSENIALNVDVSAIAGGSFTGNGKDIVVPNSTQFWTPNSGNTDFILPMAFDSGGRVLMSLQPAFRVKLSATQTASIYPLPFNSAATNRGGHFNTTSYRFTAPVAGVYLFHLAQHFLSLSSADIGCDIKKNGTVMYSTDPYSVTVSRLHVDSTILLDLSANDYIDVGFTRYAGTGNLEGGTGTYSSFFEGYLIG